jgi:GT2 family glycosyltransferase
MALPTLSVVLLSYNRPAYLEEALQSVVAQDYPHMDITVVDNRSPASEQVAALVRRYPQVRLLAQAENLGFTGGMNVGIAAATGDYVYLTEDDIVLAPGCLAALAEQLEAHPEVGLASALLLNKGSGTLVCAGGEVELGAVYRLKVHGWQEPDEGQYTTPLDVSFVPGCSMFARRELLQRLGGFRSDFFMYGEDLELCQRLLKAGWRIRVVPAARAHHFEPTPGPLRPEIEFHRNKNHLAVYLLHAPLAALPGFAVRYALVEPLRMALSQREVLPGRLRALRWGLAHLGPLLRDRRALSQPQAPAPTSAGKPRPRAL